MNTQATIHTAASVDAELFYRAINSAHYAAAKKDVRYYLNGVRLLFTSDKVRVTGTDGHCLFDVSLPAFVPTAATGKEYILAINDIKKWLKSGKRCTNDHKIELVLEGDTLEFFSPQIPAFKFGKRGPGYGAGQIIDGQYPDCDRVIPKPDNYQEADPHHFFNIDLMVTAARCLKPWADLHKHSGKTLYGVDIYVGSERQPVLMTASRDDCEARFVAMPMKK